MLKVNGETMLRWVKVAVEGEVGSRLRKEIEKREEERGGEAFMLTKALP